ncbi:hypothetical protein L7F22_044261 [Adiantum nelumboides]|nr:hypothetical protein [Adiantum nelumboides]
MAGIPPDQINSGEESGRSERRDVGVICRTSIDVDPREDSSNASNTDRAMTLDLRILEQLKELDEDDKTREFSRGVIWIFFDQAKSTFEKMYAAIERGDLQVINTLAHFLKGSSATLGVTRVMNHCECIQGLTDSTRMGNLATSLEKEKLLNDVKRELDLMITDYMEAETALRRYLSQLDV